MCDIVAALGCHIRCERSSFLHCARLFSRHSMYLRHSAPSDRKFEAFQIGAASAACASTPALTSQDLRLRSTMRTVLGGSMRKKQDLMAMAGMGGSMRKKQPWA